MSDDNKILWSKLPDKELECDDWEKRVLMFDPSNAPKLFDVRPYHRQQPVSVYDLFPKNGNKCGCGCGKTLRGRQLRWASEECQNYAVSVRFIIAGQTPTIAKFLRIYYGWNCSKCGCENKGHDMGYNGIVSWIKIDHIIPVKNGGGACWLSNYQLLCHDCHVGKTNKDFGWKVETKKVELPSLFNSDKNHERSIATDDDSSNQS